MKSVSLKLALPPPSSFYTESTRKLIHPAPDDASVAQPELPSPLISSGVRSEHAASSKSRRTMPGLVLVTLTPNAPRLCVRTRNVASYNPRSIVHKLKGSLLLDQSSTAVAQLNLPCRFPNFGVLAACSDTSPKSLEALIGHGKDQESGVAATMSWFEGSSFKLKALPSILGEADLVSGLTL